MKALQYPASGAPVRLVTVPQPVCPPDGVIVDVAATGVCRSDWHAWKGHEPVVLPHIPGHEFAGVISQVGSSVRGWRVGQRVTTPFVLGCGQCEFCRAGDAQVCPEQLQPGFSLPGSFAERVAVPRASTNLIELPAAVGFVAAASLGCRFATAFRALTAHGGVGPGQWLAVHGCGGVGLSAVMIGVALGARVVAIDLSAAALTRAAELGTEQLVDSSQERDPASAVTALTGGAHVSIDAFGSSRTAMDSVRSLRRRGRHVQVGLLFGDQAHTALPMDQVISWELAILGSHGMAAHEYPAMLELVAAGALRPDLLVSRVIGLADGGAALASMGAPAGPGMTVISINAGS